MSKVKSSAIPHYEILYIIANKYSEDEAKLIETKVNKVLMDRGGKITFNQVWGKKRLIYPIKGFTYGYYFLAEFDLAGSLLAQVDKDLRMMNDVLRHQVVVKKIKTAERIAKDKKIADKIAARGLKEEKAVEDQAKIKAEVKKKIKTEVNLKELDEKLDKILETNDLL
ncbi:30S ribosomal protein S6 [Patescibacteria group bacterium]|nr:30S ribosomal protein S6 [Patescibacteria group bacterium]MBU0879593.1 30S ribosomal protein S6 [Patescibacteria group bacterium]MBU0880525.1 30S ribosomal protein S6 [Patescibacteria group bacterium]MBU0898009.1 30S ribosomal protein S6 [Patescibacteria group bacterium]MBU1063049.1 30S ribosomal protein S6 [Patescibacteria group bacterium]